MVTQEVSAWYLAIYQAFVVGFDWGDPLFRFISKTRPDIMVE